MTPRPLFVVFASLFYLLALPIWCSADPAPTTTRPTTQNSTSDSHRGQHPQDGQRPGGQRPGGQRRGDGYGRGPGQRPGMGMGGGFSGMNQGPQWGPRGARDDGQFMPDRREMQDRDKDQRGESDGVDKKTIEKLESQLDKLSSKLDQLQKQLDDRDGAGAKQNRGNRQQGQRFSQSDDREGRNGYRNQPHKHGPQMQHQRSIRQPGPMGRFDRQNRPAPFQFDRRGGGGSEQQRNQQFRPYRGRPANSVQPYERDNHSGYRQSEGSDRRYGLGPMNGGPRGMRPAEGTHRFGPAFGRGGPQDGGPSGRWGSPRNEQRSNGFRDGQSMERGRQPNGRWNNGNREPGQMDNGREPPRRRQGGGQGGDWNDHRDGQPSPDFAGPPRRLQPQRDGNDSDNDANNGDSRPHRGDWR